MAGEFRPGLKRDGWGGTFAGPRALSLKEPTGRKSLKRQKHVKMQRADVIIREDCQGGGPRITVGAYETKGD
jgi:hypothetical protein